MFVTSLLWNSSTDVSEVWNEDNLKELYIEYPIPVVVGTLVMAYQERVETSYVRNLEF